MNRDQIMKTIEERNVNFFRLQFVDIFGFMKNVAIPRSQIEKALDGKMMFDGSSIEGFVRIGEVDENRITPEELQEMVKAGETRQATVLTSHPDKKRVYLSFRAVAKQKEREEIEKYMSPSSDSITTIGDLLQNEIDKNTD